MTSAGPLAAATFCVLLIAAGINADIFSRKLLQTVYQGSPSTITVSADKPRVDAITITLALPYPQNPYYCNVTGDARIPNQGVFPLTVRVPVGVESTVVFANITGPIPGTSCSAVQQPGGQALSVVQQAGSSVVQQPSGGSAATSVQQLVNNPSSVVQQQGASSVVQQQYASSVNQQLANPGAYFNCVSGTSVVQQAGSTVVQQQTGGGTSVVQQPNSVVQQQSGGSSSVVQQQQSGGSSSSVVQQPNSLVQQAQQQANTAVQQQQQAASSVVQQQQQAAGGSSVVQQTGRHLLQVGTIEYISNNGSTGQPALSVLDTVEGVPQISFKPTYAGQTASFNGGLQVAVTTTNDGFGSPYIPYRVDSRLSPQCAVQVNFVGI